MCRGHFAYTRTERRDKACRDGPVVPQAEHLNEWRAEDLTTVFSCELGYLVSGSALDPGYKLLEPSRCEDDKHPAVSRRDVAPAVGGVFRHGCARARMGVDDLVAYGDAVSTGQHQEVFLLVAVQVSRDSAVRLVNTRPCRLKSVRYSSQIRCVTMAILNLECFAVMCSPFIVSALQRFDRHH